MAIAFGNTAAGTGNASGTSDSTSFTVTAGSTLLIVGVASDALGFPTAMSYNSVAMTKSVDVSSRVAIWTQANPASGAHTLSISHGNNGQVDWGIIEASGASTTIGATATASNTTDNPSTNITPNNTPGVIISVIGDQRQNNNSRTTNGGQTEYAIQGNPGNWLNCSRKAYTGVSAVNMAYTSSAGGNTWWHGLMEINEAAVGPANIKNINGLVTASVKDFNGLATASVKNINGLA